MTTVPRKSRRPQGLTLMEIMIVISIIAIMAAVLIPQFTKPRKQVALQGCVQNVQALVLNVNTYHSQSGLYPSTLSLALKRNYGLDTLPTCPAAAAATYQYASNSYQFTVWCQGSHHVNAIPGGAANYPQYSSEFQQTYQKP